MIRRIELINFMSHPHTVIEPASGLTVLVGENNTGKSAVISALQVLCRNISGDYMVRHGERECRIVVETQEGHVLEWKRKSGTVSYTINGRDVHRLRGSVPEDLHDLLRLSMVDEENDPFDVHFGEQKKPIFLLDESPARRATFFASSSDAIKLIEMQNRHRSKVRDARNEENRLVKETARLQNRLDMLSPLDAAENQLASVEAEYEAIGKAEKYISAMQKHIAEIEKTVRLSQRYSQLLVGAESLSPPPEPVPTGDLISRIRQMDDLDRQIGYVDATVNSLSELQEPPAIADTRHLADLVSRMTSAFKIGKTMDEHRRILENCPPLPELADTEAVSRHLAELERRQKAVSFREKELDQTEKALSTAESSLRAYVEMHHICPTCGQPMDVDRILHDTHAGGQS